MQAFTEQPFAQLKHGLLLKQEAGSECRNTSGEFF